MAVAVLYEHPEWFRPLFDTFDRRGIPVDHIDAASLRWDPALRPPFSLLVNRMSPSAYRRGHARAIYAAQAFLAWVEASGVPVINGLGAYRLETSKAVQLGLFERLGVPYPRARVVNDPAQVVAAADGLRFPIVVKPNIGGSGAGIQRFDAREALAAAAASGGLDLGIDHTALVQEFLPALNGSITRVELLAGELLYAISITPPAGFGFNLCPADICRDEEGTGEPGGTPVAGLCATKPAMRIEAVTVPPATLRMATAIANAAGLDICGIEYLIDDRDGRPYFYDVNALSNFVTDAVTIVGFDPFERFVDYIESRDPSAWTPPLPDLFSTV